MPSSGEGYTPSDSDLNKLSGDVPVDAALRELVKYTYDLQPLELLHLIRPGIMFRFACHSRGQGGSTAFQFSNKNC